MGEPVRIDEEALTIYGCQHTVLLLWGCPVDICGQAAYRAISGIRERVDVISAKEFSQMTAGSKFAAAGHDPESRLVEYRGRAADPSTIRPARSAGKNCGYD